MLPGVRIEVVKQGRARRGRARHGASLDADVLALSPDLVVGRPAPTMPMRECRSTTSPRLTIDAIGRLHAAGIDVVLMEPAVVAQAGAAAHYAEYVERCARSGTRPARRW